jgi:hypothetical protein
MIAFDKGFLNTYETRYDLEFCSAFNYLEIDNDYYKPENSII